MYGFMATYISIFESVTYFYWHDHVAKQWREYPYLSPPSVPLPSSIVSCSVKLEFWGSAACKLLQ